MERRLTWGEEDAKPSVRCDKKRKEWAEHWQCGKEVQNQKSKPWRNEELKKLEEDMPRLARVAKTCKAKNGSRM